MATLTLHVDEETLEKAEQRARETGIDYKRDLVDRLNRFANEATLQRRKEAFRRLVASADAFPAYSEKQLTAEDRNER